MKQSVSTSDPLVRRDVGLGDDRARQDGLVAMPNERNAGRAPISPNALTIDVEDYFHVSALEEQISRSDWDSLDYRTERNMDRILGLLAKHGVCATFFTLGWVAKRSPGLIRQIVAEGHELASHGWEHVRVSTQDRDSFSQDVRRTKLFLEDTAGTPVLGYRAASFSIGAKTPWAFPILAEAGYRYSSSTYPIQHDLYGDPQGHRFAYQPLRGADFIEIPISTLRVGGRNFPCGGGGYFRLLPYTYHRLALSRINRVEGRPCVFYLHPWEIDAEQPRIGHLSWRSRIRHYTGLSATYGRLSRLVREFSWGKMAQIYL